MEQFKIECFIGMFFNQMLYKESCEPVNIFNQSSLLKGLLEQVTCLSADKSLDMNMKMVRPSRAETISKILLENMMMYIAAIVAFPVLNAICIFQMFREN